MRNRILQRLQDKDKGKNKKKSSSNLTAAVRPEAYLPEKHMLKKGDMPISTWKRIKAFLDQTYYSSAYRGYNDYLSLYKDDLINQPGYESLKKEVMEGSEYFKPTEEHYKKFNEPYEPTEKEIREGYDKIRKMQTGGKKINLNLERFRNVKNPDLMNALSIGGATFLGSAGLGSLSTHLKQKKGKRDVYEDYFDARSSGLGEESDWYQECIGPNCPQKTPFTPDYDWFWSDKPSGVEGMYKNNAIRNAISQGTLKSKEDMRKAYWDNIKKGAKHGIIAGGSSYLLNKALDNTRFGRKLQNKLGMDINLGIYKQDGGYRDPNQQQMQMGGAQQLPGGIATSIPGSDAIEFSGQTHDQGGIMMDGQTEVEDGETMDQVTMNKDGGKRKDYFFSSYLKRGGRSFADHHKDILSRGGSQEEIDYLAKMQEKAAGRKPGNIKAKLGGVMKYDNGGTFKARSDKANKIIDILRANNYDVPDVADLGSEHISENQAYLGSGYYGEKNIKSDQNREDFFNRNKETLSKIDLDGDGQPDIQSWKDFDPQKHTKSFQTQFNDDMMAMFKNDPELSKAFEEAELTQDDLKQFGFYESGTDADTGIDSHFGEYTWSRINPLAKKLEEPCKDPGCPEGQTFNPETCQCEGEEVPGEDPCPKCPDGTVPVRQEDGSCPCPEEPEKPGSPNLLGLAGMIPAVMAFADKPDYMSEPDIVQPGIVKPERIAKQHLDRVDFNDQIARNASDARAVNKAIETSGGGPASMSNMMAMYAKKQQGDREIKAQEARANIAIANEEAGMDNKRKLMNAEAALDASKFNVQSSQGAQETNAKNKMLIDEFNRGADAATKDRRLNAVQYGVNTLAQMHRDKLAYKAQDEFSHAIDGQRNAYERFLQENYDVTPKDKKTDNVETEVDDKSGKIKVKEDDKKRGGYRRLKLMRRRYGK